MSKNQLPTAESRTLQIAKETVSRRSFVRASSAALAAGAMARPAKARIMGSNDRINIASIGCGGMGTHHLRLMAEQSKEIGDIQLVAVCDVYEARKERARVIADLSSKDVYGHYQEILDRPDVDVCWIATPDHWHAPISIDAMRAGKDVYCEKPMTRTAEEAKDFARVAKETKAVVQIGVQGTSDDRAWRARGAVASGMIGKVVWSQASASRNSLGGEWNWPIDPEAGPANIDWKTWLGNAPYVPWDTDRFFRFRKYWDYSGGIATDLFYHDLAQLSIPLGAEFPHRVTGTGGIWIQKDEREVPDTFFATIDYPSEHSVVLVGSMANKWGAPTLVRGHHATIDMHSNEEGIRIVADGPFLDEFKAKYGEEVLFIPAQTEPDTRTRHRLNFLQCVRTRERTHLPPDDAYKVMAAIAMCVQSHRENKMLFWDPEKEEIVDKEPRVG